MKKDIVPFLFLVPSIIAVTVVVAIPLASNFEYSVQAKYLLGETPEYRGQFIGLQNYVTAVSDPIFWKAFTNTLVYSFGRVVGEIGLGLGLALLLNEKIKGGGIAQGILLSPWVVPSVVAAIVWRWMLNNPFGIINAALSTLGITPVTFLGDLTWAMPTVIIVSVWKGFPLITLMILAALKTVREDLMEAATLDGAGTVARFRHITLPSIWPLLSLAILMSIIWSFQYFDLPWLLTQGGPFYTTETLAVNIYRTGFFNFFLGQACAIATIMFLFLSVIITPYLKRALR